jgi:hypothetical protein
MHFLLPVLFSSSLLSHGRRTPVSQYNLYNSAASTNEKSFLDTWKDAHILATFIIGVVLLISLALHQWKFKRDGMFHHDLFK